MDIQHHLPPKLLILNDMSGVGRCSMSVSLPVVSACKVQAIPVPTLLFSNHTGFATHYKKDLTDCLPDYLSHMDKLTNPWDGIYCGYLGSLTQMQVITSYYNSLYYHPLFIIDPVMGDHGHAYQHITPEFCAAMRGFLSSADIITPNLTEACLLAGVDYPGGDIVSARGDSSSGRDNSNPTTCDSGLNTGGYCDNAFCNMLIEKLTQLGPKQIVITGIEQGEYYVNYIYDHGSLHTIKSQKTGPGYPGTGDMFASIVAAYMLRGFTLTECVTFAVDFIAHCIAYSQDLGAVIPQGVIFEPLLGELICH